MNKFSLVFLAPNVDEPASSVDALALQNVVALVGALDSQLSAARLRAVLSKVQIDPQTSSYLVPLVHSDPTKDDSLDLDADPRIEQADLLRNKMHQLIEVVQSPEEAVREGRFEDTPTGLTKQIAAQLQCAEKVASIVHKESLERCTIMLSDKPETSCWELEPMRPSKYRDARARLRALAAPKRSKLIWINIVAEGPNQHFLTDTGEIVHPARRELGKRLVARKGGHFMATPLINKLPVLKLHCAVNPDEIPPENLTLFNDDED